MTSGIQNSICRSCLEPRLFSGIDLGVLPISNELLLEGQTSTEEYPLHMWVCGNCCLGQVPEIVLPERLFSDYRYLSSVSSTFLEHAKDFCNGVMENGLVMEGDLVLEIACNDGYLLKNFLGTEVKILGVEPAKNVSKRASDLGIPVINEFFGADLATRIIEEFGYPKLVIANNVLAHVPNIRDFMLGLKILCNSETRISIENPSILNILDLNQFDTIYHEHFSYLSSHAVRNLAEMFGLNLTAVEELSTHGGSNRYWLQTGFVEDSPNVRESLESEMRSGLIEANSWIQAQERMNLTVDVLRTWLEETKERGELVLGYGAAAKASTILNYARIEKSLLPSICDLSEEKIGRRMPRVNCNIISLPELLELKPDHVLVFPWNISAEIVSQLKQDLPSSNFWVTIPSLRRLN